MQTNMLKPQMSYWLVSL